MMKRLFTTGLLFAGVLSLMVEDTMAQLSTPTLTSTNLPATLTGLVTDGVALVNWLIGGVILLVIIGLVIRVIKKVMRKVNG